MRMNRFAWQDLIESSNFKLREDRRQALNEQKGAATPRPGTINVNRPKSGIGVERQTGNQKDYPNTCPPVGHCGEWGVPGEMGQDGIGQRYRWNGKKWIHIPWGKDEAHPHGPNRRPGGGIGGPYGGGGLG